MSVSRHLKVRADKADAFLGHASVVAMSHAAMMCFMIGCPVLCVTVAIYYVLKFGERWAAYAAIIILVLTQLVGWKYTQMFAKLQEQEELFVSA